MTEDLDLEPETPKKRPRFEPDWKLVKKLASLGMTHGQIIVYMAEHSNRTKEAVYSYFRKRPSQEARLKNAIDTGQQILDGKIMSKFIERCLAGDRACIIKYIECRDERFRQKTEITASVHQTTDLKNMSMDELLALKDSLKK